MKYSDYKGKSFGTPDEIKKDVILSLRRGIPLPWKETESFITSVEDQSQEDKGIKFEIVLKSGDVIHAYKSGLAMSMWDWFLNRKKSNINSIFDHLLDKIYTPLEKWIFLYDMLDKTYLYADDRRSREKGTALERDLDMIYKKLSDADKKRADEYRAKNSK